MQKKLLSDTVRLGPLELKNRIVMAAMTRRRTDPATGIPNTLMAQYYSQRAGAGLIFSEASAVSQRGSAFPGAGNLFNREQAEGWKRVVEGVHQRGGRIFVQLVHGGRNMHPDFNGGLDIWAPSAVAARGRIPGSKLQFPEPKQLTRSQISEVKEQFLNSFRLAKEAGFDGVQLHGSNGYLIDEFLRSGTNKRTDEYGGSAQNRCRFALELIDLAAQVYPKELLSIKLSPVGRYGDMFDENPFETYSCLLKHLSGRGIGSVELVRSQGEMALGGYPKPDAQMPDVLGSLRPHFSGLVIGNQAFNKQSAEETLNKGYADLISFGKMYIANPDLAERLINGHAHNTKIQFGTFYMGGEKGYTDWPAFQPAA